MTKVPDNWKVPRMGGKHLKTNILVNGERSGEWSGLKEDCPLPRRSDEKQVERLLAKMKGTGYVPNLNDARTRKRVETVLDWCLRRNGKSRIGAQTLEKVFGMGQNPLSQYLRDVLLLRLRGHCSGKCKATEWQVSEKAVERLWFEFHKTPLDQEIARAASWKKLAAFYGTGPFTYDIPTEGGRRYHELQQMPKNIKPTIYKGYWDYDLSASNVTLISQQAKIQDEHLETPRIDKYLANKQVFRRAISQQFGITVQEAKELMQCVFSLAYFDTNENSAPFNLLGKGKLLDFTNHPLLVSLRDEMTNCWRVLLGKNFADGEKRFRAYELIEREVMDAVEVELKGLPYLLQHDGFLLLSQEPLNTTEIEQRVRARTGLDIALEERQL